MSVCLKDEQSRKYDVSEIKYLNSSLLAIVFFQTELNRAVYVHCVGKDVIEKVVMFDSQK